tara:strand:- start:517 stop:987 length:471 start_codon:yes stop_codon:yes gene_type:complete
MNSALYERYFFWRVAVIKKSKTVNTKIMQKIVDKLAEGITLVEICEAEDMPSYRSVTRAVQIDEALWELYRKGRVQQAEFYTDRINQLAMLPLPDVVDNRQLGAEVQRRKLEIETLRWTTARAQPHGVRDKKEDAPQQQAITISWAGGNVDVSADG